MNKGIERIIGKGKNLAEFMNDTRDISQRLYYLNKKMSSGNEHYLQFWKLDYYDPYRAKYKLNNEDASFNISRYILNNFSGK